MPEQATQPLIGVPACIKAIDNHPFHSVGDKYLRAVAEAAGAVPLVIPAFGDSLDLARLIARLDGLMLTGSPSNVHPNHYGRDAHPEAEPHDPARDGTTLPLIRLALEADLPMFAICRGMQELNVALGGTLHARVHELPGRMDHRRPKHEDPDVQYGPRHEVEITPGGALEPLAGEPTVMVNSLHGQAVDRVAEGLTVEAVAPDGTVEAVSVTGARSFALAVQWHPEYKALDNPFSTRLFAAFGEAARARARARGGAGPSPATRLSA
jgi:putative glutamine amidotransferase